MAEARKIDNNGQKYCNINPKYFISKSVTNLFKCIECNNIPYPCYTISDTNEFLCNKCIKLNKYNNININRENGLNAVIGKANIYCLNNNINNNEGMIVETKNNNSDFCDWKGKLSDWNEHNTMCNECLLECKNNGCNKITKRKHINIHCLNECEYELILCNNNGCNINVIKKDYAKHKKQCSKRIIDCKYKRYGCDKLIIFDELNIHMKQYALTHCKYLENALEHQRTNIEILSADTKTANNKIQSLEAKTDGNSTVNESKSEQKYMGMEMPETKHLEKKYQEQRSEVKKLRTFLKECCQLFELKNNECIELKSNIEHRIYNMELSDNSMVTTIEYQNDIKKGGLLLLKVKHNLVLKNKSQISLNGLGYKGGNLKKQGQSYKKTWTIKVSKNIYGGGGSGYDESGYYGGSGGYGTKGQSYFNALGGECYGNNKLDILYLGSGGGGSELFKGGNGGGSIKIECNKLIIHKHSGIYCNGSNGNGTSGGGSGGSIFIICNELINYGNIHAKGGNNGGFGRIRIDCDKITKKGSIIPDIGYNKYY